ncbi:MAG: hypothetical protein CMP07_03285 [Xanthomonadales bacterium]|nr:hypothetical protein [Xanthomonadales bacterium]
MVWDEYFADEQEARSAESVRGKKRTVTVGWMLQAPKSSVIFSPPKPFSRDDPKPASSKSIQHCPAAIDFDARHFVIPVPINLTLHFVREPNGSLTLKDANGEKSGIRESGLKSMLMVGPQSEWRHPDRPLIQIISPYVFIADEPCFVNQTAPYLHYSPEPRPGVQMGGRFPIHIWPRPVSWAFEWYDVSKPLILKRGEPWFYVRFETENPSARVRLVEQEKTTELEEYINSIADVSKYVNQTYSLFSEAQRNRPEFLVKPKQRQK